MESGRTPFSEYNANSEGGFHPPIAVGAATETATGFNKKIKSVVLFTTWSARHLQGKQTGWGKNISVWTGTSTIERARVLGRAGC